MDRPLDSDVNKDLRANNQDKDKDFILVLKESLRQGQGQGLTSLDDDDA